jgi:UMF1 family MFS transporter
MIYTDGLNTLFAFGGLYAAGTFGMSFSEIIIFGILINITAGLGALFFSYIDDLIGPKKVIIISLFSIIIFGFFTLLIDDKLYFFILGSALGLFIGPVQASSRSFMTRFVNIKNKGQIFGVYALSGKITAFLGPMLLSIVVILTDSQRIGMGSIILFLIIGLLLILRVKEPEIK